MPAYIVSTVVINDPDKFAAYGKAIAGLSEKYGGEYVVRGAADAALEGEFVEGERVVVVKFPNADAARNYVNDPVYLEGKAKRAGAADVRMLLIEG